jgi:hypothetical protein
VFGLFDGFDLGADDARSCVEGIADCRVVVAGDPAISVLETLVMEGFWFEGL